MLENFFESLIDEKEYICGNKFIDLADNQTIFCKTDFINEYRNTQLNNFITHNSDYHITDQVVNLVPSFKKWYAQNKDCNNNSVVGIPIGLENFEPNFTYKSKFGKYASLPNLGPPKKQFIWEMSKNFNEHKNLVYMNFNCSTRPVERTNIKNYFNKFNWIYKKENISWQEYYIDIINSKFVISPRGNGVDCHRIWESLYLRSIPIVKKECYMEEFSDLPILFINNWEEVNEEYLLKKYDEYSKMKFDLNKMKMSYWEKRIKNV